MTINVVLVTSEALILGCDSTASTTGNYLDPFAAEIRRDKAGKVILDSKGRATVKFRYHDLEEIVTDAWGGVTKMFQLCSKHCHVAGVTVRVRGYIRRDRDRAIMDITHPGEIERP